MLRPSRTDLFTILSVILMSTPKYTIDPRQVVLLFEGDDWLEVYKRSVLYLRKVYKGRINRSNAAELAEDIVQEIIFKYLDGVIRWHPERSEDLFETKILKPAFIRFIISRAVARVIQLGHKVELRDFTRFSEMAFSEGVIDRQTFDQFSEPVSLKQLIFQEQRDLILRKVGDDLLLREICILIIDEELKPSEVAERLGLDRAIIYNAYRRIKTRLR